MRIEREHRRRQAQVLGRFDEPREHRLVAAMHAVEVADRQRDRSAGDARQIPLYTQRFARGGETWASRSGIRPWKARYFSATYFGVRATSRAFALTPEVTSCGQSNRVALLL